MGLVMPDSTDVGGFLDDPGWCHLTVTKCTDQHQQQDGKISDAVVISVTCLESTAIGNRKKTTTLFLNNPNMSHKDQGQFATLVQIRAARAMGILPNAAPGQEVNIDWSKGAFSQFMAKFSMQKMPMKVGETTQQMRNGLDGAHIYRMDDPEVEAYPKHAKSFEAWKQANGLQQQQAPSPTPTPPQVQTPTPAQAPQQPAGGVSVDDI